MRRYLVVFALVLGVFTAALRASAAEATNTAPFKYVWGQAYHVLAETHNRESGYFSLCEGLNGKMYIGTAKYGVNSYVVEFDPTTEKQRIVIDTHSLCGLGVTSRNEAQSKVHTRNFVGPSGKIYVGSMDFPYEEDDPGKYPGGYVMTYDPKNDVAENLGMPYPGKGVLDVVADEGRGIIYVVLASAPTPWMLYDMKTRKYRELGPSLVVWATTLIDRRGHAGALTKDFELAQYDPDTGKVVVRDIMVDGKKLSKPAPPVDWLPMWTLAQDGRTAYLIHMQDATLYTIDLLSEGDVVKGMSHAKMIEGNDVDIRSQLSIDPDGRVYAVVRIDNETGFGDGMLHHLVRFDPQREKMEDLGVLAVKNPGFYFDTPGAKLGHPVSGSAESPSYYGYHTLPDGTLTPLYTSHAVIVTRDGTIYVTIIYPFTLLKIEGPCLPKT